MYSLLLTADSADFTSDDDEILEYFDLQQLGCQCNIYYVESFADEAISNDMLISRANNLLVKDTLAPEIERIYAGKAQLKIKGHPFHYMVRCSNREIRKNICKTLLDALYDNGRIESRRYAYTDWGTEDGRPNESYEAMYKSCEGGAVIIRYTSGDIDGRSMYTRLGGDVFTGICDIALKYRNSVLTIFCFPDDVQKARESFLENLDNISLIELTEDVVFGDCAKEHLKFLVKTNHILCDKSLLGKIEKDDKGFSTSDLKQYFENRYDAKLRTSVYPQYKEANTVKAEIQKEQPKGNAIDELNRKIGLSDTKAVIAKALNYYKIQKLYKSKGVQVENPTMHTVFSGNPGTAKPQLHDCLHKS